MFLRQLRRGGFSRGEGALKRMSPFNFSVYLHSDITSTLLTFDGAGGSEESLNLSNVFDVLYVKSMGAFMSFLM